MAGFLKRIFPYIPALLRLTAYFVKRDRDKCKEIMKVHLEKGNLMSADAYLDEDNVKYAREILKKLIHPGDQSHFLLKTHNSAIEGDVKLVQLENGHELL